jgi:hypothetical protein
VTLTGQLLNTRPLSARLAFADLRLVAAALLASYTSDPSPSDDPSSHGEGGEVVELVFKARHDGGAAPAGEAPAVAASEQVYVPSVPRALKAACVGDIVQVRGAWEGTSHGGPNHGGPNHGGPRLSGVGGGSGYPGLKKVRSLRCCEAPVVLEAWAAAGGGVPFAPVFTAAAAGASPADALPADAAANGASSASAPSLLPEVFAEPAARAPPATAAAAALLSTADSGVCKFFVNTGRCESAAAPLLCTLCELAVRPWTSARCFFPQHCRTPPAVATAATAARVLGATLYL